MFYITLKTDSDAVLGELVCAITRAVDSGEISEPFEIKTEELQDRPDGFLKIEP